MSNGPKRVSELFVANAVANSDLLVVIANTSGNSVTVSMTVADFSSTMHFKTTPISGSATTVKAGRIFYDNNYIYVAIANNVVKRVLLETF